MGRKNATSPVTSVASKMENFKLDEEEQSQVRGLEENIKSAKLELADFQVQLLVAEQQRATLANKVVQAQQSLMERVKGICKERGIDIEDPAKGKWNLDTKTMVLTRVE